MYKRQPVVLSPFFVVVGGVWWGLMGFGECFFVVLGRLERFVWLLAGFMGLSWVFHVFS